MHQWTRWLQAPQTLWWRRALFQVHLWMGIGFGLYILVISVSGSAIVLRPQISRWLIPSQVPSTQGAELVGEALDARVNAVYSDGYTVARIVPSTREGRATYVALTDADGTEVTRFFDQYAGVDLGSTYPWPVAAVEWLTRLHDELLLGRPGRKLNGLGGALFLLMTVSGVVIWWQGSKRWKEGLLIRRDSTRSFSWQLHSFVGFWTLLLMFVWGFTSVYFAWPGPFDALIDWMDTDPDDFERPEGWLLTLIDFHFGRFRGLLWANVLWIFLGLLPAVMFITGFILWYRRVLKRLL
ncbi:MAG TPA: PepSY-associated TM helix domain-containing protein [Pseudomonadales bacterium]